MTQFYTKLHVRFNQGMMQDLFTVDCYGETESIKVKCMPNSYPRAIDSIENIYKVFSQMYIESKDGTLNQFVCDFLQDERGRFYFLKIHDYGTDGKPILENDWKVSTKFTEKGEAKRKAILAAQVCTGRLICHDQVSLRYFQKAVSAYDPRSENASQLYPQH